MRTLFFLFTILLLNNAGWAQRKGKLSGGGTYRIVKDVPGTIHPKAGDYLLLVPVSSGVAHEEGWNVVFGDMSLIPELEEGIGKMTVGDIAEIRVGALRAGKKPVKSNAAETYQLKLVTIESQADHLAKLQLEGSAGAQAYADKVALIAFFRTENLRPERTLSGMYYSISKPGSGRKTAMGDTVSMLYTGRRLDGFVFDTNTDSAKGPVKPLTFVLQPGLMIKGFEEALMLLPEGAAGRFYIPSGLGYGPSGNGPKIPPHSVLIFDIERTRTR